jgi:hypothetical protein
VPGQCRARDEQLGFVVEVAKLVKAKRFCGWKKVEVMGES